MERSAFLPQLHTTQRELPAPPREAASSPPPATFGNGSVIAATTRFTPDRSTASVQGGVWPWWQHGSSVTMSVPPLAFSPAASRA